MKKLLLRLLLNMGALYLTVYLVNRYYHPQSIELRDISSAFFAVLLLALVNTFIRPILKLLTLPLNFISLGLFSFTLNALMLILVSFLFSLLSLEGFCVHGFIPALLGAVTLSIIGSILGSLFK